MELVGVGKQLRWYFFSSVQPTYPVDGKTERTSLAQGLRQFSSISLSLFSNILKGKFEKEV